MQLKYLIFTLFLVACSTQQYLPNEFPKKQLIFGNGGGFTGLSNTYVLQENGQLFQTALDDTYTELSQIPKKQCKILFKQYQNMQVDTLGLNNPGNMYQFLNLKETDTTYTTMWGGGQGNPPDTVQVFYRALMDIVRSVNESKAGGEGENGGDQ